MDKDLYIRDMIYKLVDNERLTTAEINSVVAALRESSNCLQEPYYEVIYHDEFGKTETRIMNPVHSSTKPFNEGYDIRDDRFEINFKRIVKRRKN